MALFSAEKRARKITSIAELKKAVEGLHEWGNLYGIDRGSALKLISEFEASVRERLIEIAMPSHISPYADEKELRWILGEGGC